MIYVDTSVVLAHLLAEDRCPPPDLWRETLVSSRLLEYECWTRVHSRGLTDSHSDALGSLLGRLAFLELSRPVLARAHEPYPVPVRTLDALHLASIEFLRGLELEVQLACYDDRLLAAARALEIPLYQI